MSSPPFEPPKCLSSLRASREVAPDVDLDTTSGGPNCAFALRCPCGCDRFGVMSILHEHYYLANRVAYGPISLHCCGCSRMVETFNPASDGFDPALGHFPPSSDWSSRREQLACPHCQAAAWRLLARFDYPESVVKAKPTDFPVVLSELFSFFTLLGTCGNCSQRTILASVSCA